MSRWPRTTLAAVFVLAMFLGLGTPQAASQTRISASYRIFLPVAIVPTSFWSNAELQAVNLINQHRQAHGCQPVRLSQELGVAAKNHSRDMAENRYFSHTGLNGSTFGDRARAAGYAYWPSGEIIAAGYASASEVVNGWMNSPGHRAIILDCNNDDMGLGFYAQSNSEWHYYWTGVFGQR